MSKQRSKGTQFESYLIPTYLRQIWPDAARRALQGVNDFGDFINVGEWLIEAKKHNSWRVFEWIRKCMSKTDGSWMILAATDKRSGIPDMAILPAKTLFELLEGREG